MLCDIDFFISQGTEIPIEWNSSLGIEAQQNNFLSYFRLVRIKEIDLCFLFFITGKTGYQFPQGRCWRKRENRIRIRNHEFAYIHVYQKRKNCEY